MYKVEVVFGRTFISVVTGTSEFLQQEYCMWYTVLCRYLQYSFSTSNTSPWWGGRDAVCHTGNIHAN